MTDETTQPGDPRPEPAPEAAVASGDPTAGGATNGRPTDAADAQSERPAGAPEGDGYRVHLERFDGPLDLLLYLIREEEVDITDIPIARITDQYLESIQAVDALDLDRAGEYLLMAATLMRIKAKMLIPRDEDEDDDEDGIDPREELVRRLLEYREFKRVAGSLRDREDEWRQIFRRATAPLPEMENEDFDDLGVSLVDVFRAFQKVLDELDQVGPLEMEMEEYSVSEQIDFIRVELKSAADGVPFTRLFEGRRSRSLVITTFLALLEMIREREVAADQVDRFGEIWLHWHKEVMERHES